MERGSLSYFNKQYVLRLSLIYRERLPAVYRVSYFIERLHIASVRVYERGKPSTFLLSSLSERQKIHN